VILCITSLLLTAALLDNSVDIVKAGDFVYYFFVAYSYIIGQQCRVLVVLGCTNLVSL